MSNLVVEINNAVRVHGDESNPVYALNGVDLSINDGDFMSLAGPSGSGKSTLLHLIGGLDLPTEGRVRVEGIDLANLKEKERTELRLYKIGFVFQSFNLIPVLSASENVEFIMQLQGADKSLRRSVALEALASLGISDLADRRPGEMSGGQQQRVAIARAIASNPVLLLADEPSANLDSTSTQELCEVLRRINRERGVTVVTATHDPVVMGFASRRIELQDGAIVASSDT